MTHKFVGQFAFKNDAIVKEEAKMPIPPKQEWNAYSIWQFNGKRYQPVTQKAVDGLEALVKQIQNAGFKSATKDGKRKPSSIKYAICTYGVEDFRLLK